MFITFVKTLTYSLRDLGGVVEGRGKIRTNHRDTDGQKCCSDTLPLRLT